VSDRTSVGLEKGNAVISTEINGTRIDLKLPIGGDRPAEVQAQPAQPPPQGPQ